MSKVLYGLSMTTLSKEVKVEFRVSKVVIWVFMVVAAMGLLMGGFLMVAVKKWVMLVVVALFLVLVLVVVVWNCVWGRKRLLGFVRRYPDVELRGPIDGQYIKSR
ncbi:membrane protein [Pyrus ussuriensis x Pyrus communis]|uniref:Membrane protein n=1 Tax=Pyrus ussuriensis x Pyrus communis TaxID=2448454 RepID=A0A5N5GIA6_9ROSA|nr:membrane protein [Pyrus ussuriensis x Pyrus communis]